MKQNPFNPTRDPNYRSRPLKNFTRMQPVAPAAKKPVEKPVEKTVEKKEKKDG